MRLLLSNATLGKVNPRTGYEGRGGGRGNNSILSLTSALDGSGWSTPRLGRLILEKDPVPSVQEAGWAPRPVWTGAENLAPTGIRSRTVHLVASRYID